MVAGITETQPSGPAPQLTQPSFDVPGTNSNVTLTGAYQLTLRPPAQSPSSQYHDPIFTGETFLRTVEDNPNPGLSYGERVLSDPSTHTQNVIDIFYSQFNDPRHHNTGVPVKRYDLTGYGATLFSDWTDPNPSFTTAVVKADFVTTVGRTSHEIVEVQSVIHPWHIQVVRTITIERLNSGLVQRTDSRWVAASDGTFQGDGIAATDVHKGVIDSLLKVQNIQEFGEPIKFKPPSQPDSEILMQPVIFDCEIAINTTDYQVLQGGSQVIGLDQTSHTAVPSTGIIGYISLTYGYSFSPQDLLSSSGGFLNTLPQSPGGPMQATINLGSANSFRCVTFSADHCEDYLVGRYALVITVHGLPTLPSGGAWTVALQGPDDSAPQALPSTQSVPVVQPNGVSETHFADPSDIFRLDSSLSNLPPVSFLYGFLQDVTTQKTFHAQPFIRIGSFALSLRAMPKLADPGMLLGISNLPSISFPSLETGLPLPNFPGSDSLGSSLGPFDYFIFWGPPSLPGLIDEPAATNLFDTTVAKVDLVYNWQYDSPPPLPPAAPTGAIGGIHITLASPTWSIDIYGVALKLTIPKISNEPALWLEGSFQASSETLPTFTDLQVFYDGPLKPITQFFTALQQLGPLLGGNGTSPDVDNDDNGGTALDVHFADGKLTIQDTLALPDLPLGPGTISGISLDLGAAIDILNQSVDFMVGIGSQTSPVHWIVDPLSGTGYLQAGVQSGDLAVTISLGLGLGLAIDLAVASGSASITVAFTVSISNNSYGLMLSFTGQAQVTVFGGVASAGLSLSCMLGLTYTGTVIDTVSAGKITTQSANDSTPTATATGTASVGIHIHICWVVSIDFNGSWSFSHEFKLK